MEDLKHDRSETDEEYKRESDPKGIGVIRDANSRTIFRNSRLTCQFLRDYSGVSVFSDLKPEDIEDVTEIYKAYLGVEFETDTVKKIKIRVKQENEKQEGENRIEEIFVLPLVEHKSYVDYDVAMQLLRYMVVIWKDYRDKKNREKNASNSRKRFRYPPIIPIVYYEGTEEWTADLNFSRRINLSSSLKEYIPEFKYHVVRIHDYTNEELVKKNDEIALIMAINKIQTPKDYEKFLEECETLVNQVYGNATQDIRVIVKEILWSLFISMNIPAQEAQEQMDKMEGRGMGYLFENIKIDMQAERRKLRDLELEVEATRKKVRAAEQEVEAAKQEAETVKQKVKAAKQEAETAKQEAETAKQEVETAKRSAEDAVRAADAKVQKLLSKVVQDCKEKSFTKEETKIHLKEFWGVSEEEAAEAVCNCWNDER